MSDDGRLSTTQAAALAQRNIRYIRSLIERGHLSAIRDESGDYRIDPAEAARVLAARARFRGHGAGGGRPPRTDPKQDLG